MVTRPVRALALAVAFGVLALDAGVATAQVDRDSLRRELDRIEAIERSGQLARARAEIERLLADTPTDPDVVLAYERICRLQGKLEDAVLPVERAVQSNPSSVRLRQLLLGVLADLDRVDELRRVGDDWLRMDPSSAAAYGDYAMALRRVGRFHDAERVLKRGLVNVPRTTSLTVQLGDLYLDQGRWADAAATWTELLDESADPGWELISHRFEALGTVAPAAATAILEWLSNGPQSPSRLSLAAMASIYAGRPEAASQAAGALIAGMEPEERARFSRRFARLAAANDQPALVAWSYRAMLDGMPADSLRWDVAQQIVAYDLSAGDTASALGTLDTFLTRAEPGTPAHRWAGGLRTRVVGGQDPAAAEEALEDYRHLYPADPDLPDLALAVAEAEARHGRTREADRVLDSAPAIEPGHPLAGRAAVLAAYLALYRGDYEEARANLELAAAVLRGDARSDALRLLGFLRSANAGELGAVAAAHRAALQEHWSEAFDRLIDGLEGVPPSAARPDILLWAGRLGLNAGSTGRAQATLRRLAEQYPRSGAAPIALVTLAESLTGAGRDSEAIDVLETLILEYPESALTPIGRRRLAELRGEVPKS